MQSNAIFELEGLEEKILVMENQLKNKIILVTGTNSGIGKSIVKSLEKEKCIIIATSRKRMEKNKKNIFYYNLDVTNENQWKELIHDIKIKFGRLDVLICNAGISYRSVFEHANLDVFEKLFKINFFGSIYSVKLNTKISDIIVNNLNTIILTDKRKYKICSYSWNSPRANGKRIFSKC